MTRVVLIGGGHSHVEALRAFARRPRAGLQLCVISPELFTPYSGMLPGVIAGHYPASAAHLDLARLCSAAGAELLQDQVTALEPDAGVLHCQSGAPKTWDLLSVNSGSTPSLESIDGAGSRGIPVKPIGEFLPRWDQLLRRLAASSNRPFRLAIVGAGAGGVELALAIDYRLRRVEGCGQLRLVLIDAAPRLLPEHTHGLGQRLARILAQREIEVHTHTRVAAARAGGLETSAAQIISADEILWVTPGKAPAWPAAAGLATDAAGFIRVDDQLRSMSHPRIFATGDVASFDSRPLPKAGVYAVRQGPVLAENLSRAALGQPLLGYRPQVRFLTLISTGDRYAVAARGGWTAQGAWIWRWKDWLDRRFVAGFR
ncbi:MAG: FAD-dependent oxidoreductase [Gammaproteobacteria bacterium]